MEGDAKYFPSNNTYWVPERSIYAQWIGEFPNPCRKYHISSDVPSAEKIAKLVLPILSKKRIFHKVVASESFLKKQSAGDQAGKFITVYMESHVEHINATIAELGEKLVQMSEESGIQPCPRIPRSRAYRHVFIEQPLDKGLFIYGGFITDPTD